MNTYSFLVWLPSDGAPIKKHVEVQSDTFALAVLTLLKMEPTAVAWSRLDSIA
jgi:hypothetical protein